MVAAMDALPEKKLVLLALESDGQVCAIGSVGLKRGIDMSKLDPEDYSTVARTFGISEAMAREIMFMNDEGSWRDETPEARFNRMRGWVADRIKP